MMVWPSIIVAVVITVLATVLFFTVKSNIQLQKELDQSIGENYDHRNTILRLEKELSFKEGLQLARKTDTLYKQILKQCEDKQRFTVMMNGTKDGDMNK